MRILNNFIQTLKVPVPFVDRILELAALFILIMLLIFTAVLYLQAPEQIPVQFDWKNEPTNWAAKEMYWFMATFFVVLMLVSSASAYNFKMVNLPVRLKVPVVDIQKKLIARMCRWLTLSMGFMWFSYLLSTIASSLDITIFARIFSNVSLFFLLAIVAFYSVKVWWIGRRF